MITRKIIKQLNRKDKMKKSLPYSITVEKIDNGFLLLHREQLDDDYIQVCKEAFKDEDGEDEGIVDVLYTIAEYFGIHYSKHNKNNLEISFKKNKDFE